MTAINMKYHLPGRYPLCTSKWEGVAADGQVIEQICDPPGVVGRYVLILVAERYILSLCEVEVYGGLYCICIVSVIAVSWGGM